MKNRFLLGSLFALLVVALLGASNIPQGWSWNATLNAFQVLMKDGGGTKFVASAKGVTDGSVGQAGMVGEFIEVASSGFAWGSSAEVTNIATYTLQPGEWSVTGTVYGDLSTGTWYQVRGSVSSVSATHATGHIAMTPWGSYNTVTAMTVVTPTRRFRVAAGSTLPIYLTASVYTAPATGAWSTNSRLVISRVR